MIDYVNHRLIVIGKLNIKCRLGDALKRNEETPGFCCSGGEGSHPLLAEPESNLYFCTMSRGVGSNPLQIIKEI